MHLMIFNDNNASGTTLLMTWFFDVLSFDAVLDLEIQSAALNTNICMSWFVLDDVRVGV